MCYPIIFINYEIFAIFPTFCGFALSYSMIRCKITAFSSNPAEMVQQIDDFNTLAWHKDYYESL